MTVFWKTDRIDTNTEIHFLPVDKSHTHALFKDTEHLRLDGQVCFYRQLFSDAVKPLGCLSWPLWPLRGNNKTAWGAKLILTADLAYPVSCAGLGHLLMENHCPLSLNVYFTLPTAPHQPTPYRLNPCYYFLLCRFGVGILHYVYKKATMYLILQIGISRDTECVNTVGFPKSGYIRNARYLQL